MRIVKYISTAIFVFLPIIAMSEDIAVPSDVGTEVLMETTYKTGKDITTKGKMILMKQGNRVRIEKLVEIEGKERLTGVSIYDGQTTWEISPMGTHKSDDPMSYPWNCPQCAELKSKTGYLEGREVNIIETVGAKIYIDAERNVILLEEREGENIYYRDYLIVGDLGYIPSVIERISRQGKLLEKTELKNVDKMKVFPSSTFDPDEVEIEFPEEIKILN